MSEAWAYATMFASTHALGLRELIPPFSPEREVVLFTYSLDHWTSSIYYILRFYLIILEKCFKAAVEGIKTPCRKNVSLSRYFMAFICLQNGL